MNMESAYFIAEAGLFIASSLMIKFSPENSKTNTVGLGMMVVLFPGCVASFAAQASQPPNIKFPIWPWSLAGNLVGLGFLGWVAYRKYTLQNRN